jgi:hypothetical protein
MGNLLFELISLHFQRTFGPLTDDTSAPTLLCVTAVLGSASKELSGETGSNPGKLVKVGTGGYAC